MTTYSENNEENENEGDAPPATAAAMRRALTAMEDEYVTLLRSDVSTDQGELKVILEGRLPPAADALHPAALVFLPEEATLQQPLEVTLEWGSYRETASLDQRGGASFSPAGTRRHSR